MGAINLARLEYFSVVAREGSLVGAAEVLRTTHSNLSTQMKALEQELGADLFERRGRRLVLTAFGNEAAWYADEVARLGRDVVEIAHGHVRPRKTPLRVGIVRAVPKALAARLLEPALAVAGGGALVARQDSHERLLEELALGHLHLVLSDVPAQQGGPLKLYGHALGSSTVSLYATPALAKKHVGTLPEALQDAPVLMPARGTTLRRAMERWLADHGVRVELAGEFDDVAMMRVFGLRGWGIFPVRDAMRAEVEDMGAVTRLGSIEGCRERYYAISVERRVKHPAVHALIEAARKGLAQRG